MHSTTTICCLLTTICFIDPLTVGQQSCGDSVELVILDLKRDIGAPNQSKMTFRASWPERGPPI